MKKICTYSMYDREILLNFVEFVHYSDVQSYLSCYLTKAIGSDLQYGRDLFKLFLN